MILRALVHGIAGPKFVVHETVGYEFSRPVVLGLVVMDCPGVGKEDGAFRQEISIVGVILC